MTRPAPGAGRLLRVAVHTEAAPAANASDGSQEPHSTADVDEKPGLTPYEARQVALIQAWLDAPPSTTVRGYRQVKQAIGQAARKVLPKGTPDKVAGYAGAAGAVIRRAIPSGAIEGAINANVWLAEQWADEHSVLRDLGAQDFGDLGDYDLERLDAAANRVQNWAIGYAGLAGGIAGAGGILIAAPAVAVLINISMRTIRRIGLCYGYQATDHLERRFMLQVLALAGDSGNQAAKLGAAELLREMQLMLARKTWKSMAEKAAQDTASKEAFLTALRVGARKIGMDLTKKRALTAVPIIGGGVGLLLDGNYLRQVGWTARHCYQRRWLSDRGRWPEP